MAPRADLAASFLRARSTHGARASNERTAGDSTAGNFEWIGSLPAKGRAT